MPSFKPKSSYIFYALAIYICLQFGWWTYMLISLNHKLYLKEKTELIDHAVETEIPMLEANWSKKRIMIIGEGSVFLLILILGFYKVKSSFNKELILANQKKNFLLSITHELKSPVTSIKLHLQTLLKREFPKEKKEEMISNTIKETERLNSLIENLLIAAKIESNSIPLHKEKTDLNSYIDETLQGLKYTYKNNYLIKNETNQGLFLNIDKLVFSSIVINLVENAIKYSPSGSAITISSKNDRGKISIKIADEGTGVPDKEKPLIFNKFYRIGNEDTRTSKGTGLGLFIVKSLVEKLGGEIIVRDNYPKGSIFEIIFEESNYV